MKPEEPDKELTILNISFHMTKNQKKKDWLNLDFIKKSINNSNNRDSYENNRAKVQKCYALQDIQISLYAKLTWQTRLWNTLQYYSIIELDCIVLW